MLLRYVVYHIFLNCSEVSLLGFCLSCVPHTWVQQACPDRSQVHRPLGIHGRSPLGVTAVSSLLMCVGADKSPLTQKRHLLGQCNMFDGATVALPEEQEAENYHRCLLWQNASVMRCSGKARRRLTTTI